MQKHIQTDPGAFFSLIHCYGVLVKYKYCCFISCDWSSEEVQLA